MAWATLSDGMLRTTLRTFGIPVTYVRDGVQTPISKALFDENYISVDPQTGATIQSDNPMITVRRIELPNGEALEGDTVIINGVTYRVLAEQKDSEGATKIPLHRLP